MESKNDLNLDFIGIYNTAHDRDIVTVNVSLFHETII